MTEWTWGDPWIGVDFDGTLAEHEPGANLKCGAPIKPMVERVKKWLAEGKRVRIVTARVHPAALDRYDHALAIDHWCLEHFGQHLGITSSKDPAMVELWDDRAVRVVRNTGYIDNTYGAL